MAFECQLNAFCAFLQIQQWHFSESAKANRKTQKKANERELFAIICVRINKWFFRPVVETSLR